MKTRFKSIANQLSFGKYKAMSLSDILEKDPQYVSWLYTSGAASFSKTCLKQISEAGNEDIVTLVERDKEKKTKARQEKQEKAKKTEKFNELIKQGNWKEAEKYI